MKKIMIIIGAIFLFANNLLALPSFDAVNYVKNPSRTSWLLREASGSLRIIDYVNDDEMGQGYIVNVKYRLNVFMRGEQSGDMKIFVPERVFSANFYDSVKNQPLSLGVFNVNYLGQSSAKDSSNKEYNDCSMIELSDFNPNFAGASNQVKVIDFDHSGSIAYVSNLNIKFRSHPDAAVIGAVEMDISGVSNNGIGFYIGLDLVP